MSLLDAATAVDRRLLLGAGLAATASAGSVRADSNFPSRPFTLTTADPGGGSDQLARLMRLVLVEQKISPRPIEVVNRGGSAGAIGLVDLISRHHGDPYRAMLSGGSVVATTMAQNSPFRMTDALPLARLTKDTMVVVVPAESPFRTMEEFAAAFRRDPDAITWCGGSAGGVDHILAGSIAEACGISPSRLRYIAYKGSGPASAALLGAQVTAGAAGYGEWRNLAASGRARILASASPERIGDGLFPTLREAGIEVLLENWRGIIAAPGLEANEIAWWTQAMARMHQSEMWRGFLEKNGWEDGFLAGDQFLLTIQQDEKRFAELLPRLGIGGASTTSLIGPGFFPGLIGTVGAVAVGATLIENQRSKDKPVVAAGADDEDEGGGPPPAWNRLLAGAGLVLLYIAALMLIGFVLAAPVLVVATSYFMGSKKLIRDGISGVFLTAAIWLVFTHLLHVDLP